MKEIKSKEDLLNFVKNKLIQLAELINIENEMPGTKFEIFCYDDFNDKDKIDMNIDLNKFTFDFFYEYLQIHPRDFLLLPTNDKIYKFLEEYLKDECLPSLQKNNGEIIFDKGTRDFKMQMNIYYEKNFIRINFVIKVIVLKYN